MEGGSNSPPPFLMKTYEMVDDSATDSIVSWSNSGDSFIVWNLTIFSSDLLPKYFKHNNFSSFVRQLNTYGFRKMDPEQWEFGNEDFLRGQRHLLKNIHRRKPVHSHSLQSQVSVASPALSETERHELEGKIERLKHDKGALLLELNNHAEQQNVVEREILSLEEKMQVLLNRQRDIMDFLSHVLHVPGFLSNLLQQPEIHAKKRRLLINDCIEEDINKDPMHDGQIISSIARFESLSIQTLDLVPYERLESTLNTLDILFRNASEASGGDIHYGCSMPSVRCSGILTDVNLSASENGVNSLSPSPSMYPSSPCEGDVRSCSDLADSTSYVDDGGISSAVAYKKRSDIADIDVNSEPTAPEEHHPKDATNGVGTSLPAGVNDVFWQQFLTETPGSDMQEVQSERKETEANGSEEKKVEWGSYWWNKKNMDHLTEKIGHLRPAESV